MCQVGDKALITSPVTHHVYQCSLIVHSHQSSEVVPVHTAVPLAPPALLFALVYGLLISC